MFAPKRQPALRVEISVQVRSSVLLVSAPRFLVSSETADERQWVSAVARANVRTWSSVQCAVLFEQKRTKETKEFCGSLRLQRTVQVKLPVMQPDPSRSRCLAALALWSFAEQEVKITVTFAVDAGVVPAVSIVTDMPQPNRRVGHDGKTALARSMTECEIFRQVPVPVALLVRLIVARVSDAGCVVRRSMHRGIRRRSRSNHGKKKWPHRAVRVLVAHR